MTQAKDIVPRAEQCRIIQFSGFVAAMQKRKKFVASMPSETLTPREKRRLERQISPAATETGKNLRLRAQRYSAWRDADTARSYWRCRLDLESAISCVQRRGLAEGSNHLPAKKGMDERAPLITAWRAAVAHQFMTPAPTLGAVTWKKSALKSGQHDYTGLTPAKIERAIADDEAFLAAHPVRKGGKRST